MGTNFRGYFRLEWKLAAQRTQTIADGTPFLLPVVIDATSDSEALVPEEFRSVQWTRLAGGEATPAFVACTGDPDRALAELARLLRAPWEAAPLQATVLVFDSALPAALEGGHEPSRCPAYPWDRRHCGARPDQSECRGSGHRRRPCPGNSQGRYRSEGPEGIYTLPSDEPGFGWDFEAT